MNIKHISAWKNGNDDFELLIKEWLTEHLDVEIIDINYSATYHHYKGDVLFSALIQYKEKTMKCCPA